MAKYQRGTATAKVHDIIRLAGGQTDSDDAPVTELDPYHIEPNPYQPRRTGDPEADAELRESIKEGGIHEPLVVRPVEGGYQLVAGGRRLAAAQELNLATVPVYVRTYSDQQAETVALVENLQRKDLHFEDEAAAFVKLQQRHELSARAIAKMIGKSADYVDIRLAAARRPDVMGAYLEGRINMAQILPMVRQGAGSANDMPKLSAITTAGNSQPATQPAARRPHNAYRPLDAAITTLAKLSAAPLDDDERLELRRRALKIREAADRVLEQLGDEDEGRN